MREAQDWREVAFGVQQENNTESTRASADGLDFGRVNLTTPVLPPLHPKLPAAIEELRASLRAGAAPDYPNAPMSDNALLAQRVIQQHVAAYVEPDCPRADRLYVLEFQGPRQYVMFGHSTILATRVVKHCLDATPHGYALLAAWASPGVDNAQPLEQMALDFGCVVHKHWHYRERFYEMPFETGLNIVRTVFELHSDWRSRLVRS